MGFVGDDGEAFAFGGGELAHSVEGEGERLNGADDDLLGAREGLGELGALAAVLSGDGGDDAGGALEVEDGFLELGVDDVAVGDDEHRVEDLLVVGVVQLREEVGGPRDGVRLPRARRVLHEVLRAWAVLQHRGHQLSGHVELVVAREDEGLDDALLVLPGDEVAADNLEPALARPDLLPEVGGAVAVRVEGVPGATLVAPVEGEEGRDGPLELGGHVDFAVADGEVHEGAAGEAEQRFGGVALRLRRPVETVLVNGVADALGEVSLELDGRDGDSVEEQHQVDRVLVVERVPHLTHHAQAVGLVAGEDVWVHAERGLELGQLDRVLHAHQLDAVAQDIEGAALVELGSEAVEERLFGLAPVVLRERLPGLRLSGLHPGCDVGWVQRASAVVVLRILRREEPVVNLQVRADLVLEVDLFVQRHGTPSNLANESDLQHFARLNEDVRVKEVLHAVSPSLRATSITFAALTLSKRPASRMKISWESADERTARVNAEPFRDTSVR